MATEDFNQLAYKLKKAIDKRIIEKFASGIIEANQLWEENKRNSLNEQSKQNVQSEQGSKVDKKKRDLLKTFFFKSQEEQKTLNIGSPIIETGYTNAESVPIQLFGTKGLADSRRISISSDISTFSSFKPDTFQGNDDIISLKSQISIDSGISSLSEISDLYSSNESLVSQDITEDLKNEKIGLENEISIKMPSIQGRPVKLAKKVVPPTVPTFKPKSFDVNNPDSTSIIGENSGSILDSERLVGEEVNSAKEILEESLKADRSNGKFTSLKNLMPLQEKVKEINRKDQLSFEIDEFIPQVSVSARKTVEERVKYGTFDTLKANVDRLNLKVNKVDSLLKSRSLIKVDKNNNSEVLLVTKKDIPLLKELKRDLKQELYEANKQLSKETKKILIYEQSKQQELQDKILKGDITKIEEAVSKAKSETDLKERSSLLSKLESDLKVAYSHLGKNLHPDLKSAITELRKERWVSGTNIWAIKPDDTTKNYLPESRIDLTFAEKKEIFSRKRDAAKSLLDDQQVRGEDKEVLKGLYKLYSNLAKSSEGKPKEKSNLEDAFNKEFGHAYKESCRTRLSEISLAPLNQAGKILRHTNLYK